MPNEGVSIEKVRNGRGLVAMRTFPQGEAVFTVTGSILTVDEEMRLPQEDQDNSFRFSQSSYVSPKGELGEFLNHSCEPNAAVRKDNAMLTIRALRDIAPGEEVTIDYSTILADDDPWQMKCKCGAPSCRKLIRRFSSLPEPLKQKYRELGAVPEYIDRGIVL